MSKKYIITCLELNYTARFGKVNCTSNVTIEICNSFEEAIDKAYNIACTARNNTFKDERWWTASDSDSDEGEPDISIPKSNTGTYTNILDDLYDDRGEYNHGKSLSITTKLLDDNNNQVGSVVKTDIYSGGMYIG